jgi:hypothetical protein
MVDKSDPAFFSFSSVLNDKLIFEVAQSKEGMRLYVCLRNKILELISV